MQKSLPSVFRSRPFAVAALATVLLFSLCAGTALAGSETNLSYVVLSPIPHTGGDTVVKFYPTDQYSGFANATTFNIHWGAFDADGHNSWTDVPGVPMTWVTGDSAWETTISIPDDAVSLQMCFNDGNNWAHFPSGGDWQCDVLPLVTLTVPPVANATVAAETEDGALSGTDDGSGNTQYPVPKGMAVTVTYTADAGYHVAGSTGTTRTYPVSGGVMANDYTLDASGTTMEINTYIVTFTWHDGVITYECDHGTSMSAPPNNPPSYVEEGKIYSFTGWNPAEIVSPVTAGAAYEALYDEGVPAIATVNIVLDDTVDPPVTETIGTYASLREAIAHAPEEATVVLLADDTVSFADIEVIDGVPLNGAIVIDGDSITIDGAGFTVTGVSNADILNATGSATPGYDMVADLADGSNLIGFFVKSGDVTVKDITLTGFGDTAYVNKFGYTPIQTASAYDGDLVLENVNIDKFNRTAVCVRGGTLAMTGGTITANATHKTDDHFQQPIEIRGGTATIDGVTVESDFAYDNGGGAIVAWSDTALNDVAIDFTGIGIWSDAATVTVTGDDTAVEATDKAIFAEEAGSVTVEAGDFTGALGVDADAASAITVNGGTFDAPVPAEFAGDGLAPTTVAEGGKYTVKTARTVTFESEAGTIYTNTVVADGEPVAAPVPAPEKAHYSFRAWQLNGTDYDFSTAVIGDITLVADWTVNQYTVAFEWHDGSSSAKYDYGTAVGGIDKPRNPAPYVENGIIYTFSTWTPEIVAVTTDATYTAQYSSVAAVAKDNLDNYYASLAGAVAEAPAGGTVTLLADAPLSDTVVIAKDLTIDLDGNDIAATGCRALWVKAGNVAITGSGKISADEEAPGFNGGSSVIRVGDSVANTNAAALSIGADVTVATETCYGVTVFGKNDADNDPATADISFDLSGTVAVTSSGDADAAISGQGRSDYLAVDITIHDGAVVSSANSAAIYFPGAGTLTTEGTIAGLHGIVARAGNIAVNGGSVTATGTGEGESLGDSNEIVVPYAAIAYTTSRPDVWQHYVSGDKATINGGTVSSAVAPCVLQIAAEGDAAAVLIPADSAALFSDAEAEGVPEGYALVESESNPGFYAIAKVWTVAFVWHDGLSSDVYVEGTAASDIAKPRNPAPYVEAGLIYTFSTWTPEIVAVTTNATYTATYTSAAVVAKDNLDNYYASLAAAVAGAPEGGTVTLLAASPLAATVTIDKDLTIDLDGNDIAATGCRALWVKAGNVAITGSGTVSADEEAPGFNGASSVIRVGDGAGNATAAALSIGEDVTVATETCYGVTVFGKNDTDNDPATPDISFDLYGTVAVTSVGGQDHADAAISGNGHSSFAAVAIAIHEGAVVSSENTAAIYFPGAGTLATEGDLTGTHGIVARAGSVAVNGGSVTATGTAPAVIGDTAAEVPCAAVVYDTASAYYWYAAGDGVEINGGTISSAVEPCVLQIAGEGDEAAVLIPADSAALFSDAEANGVPEGYALVESGSEPGFYAIAKVWTVAFVWHDGISSDVYVEGTAASDIAKPRNPAPYVEDGFIYTFDAWTPEIVKVTADATYTATYTFAAVVAKDNLDNYYASLAAAVAGAPEGGTVTLLAASPLSATVTIDKDLTIDLDGNDIAATGCRALWVKAGNVAITGNGKISADEEGPNFNGASSVIRVGDSVANTNPAALSIGADVTVATETCYGVTVFGKNDVDNDPATLDISFDLYGTVAVTSIGGQDHADAAISGNGLSSLAAVAITIHEGAVVSSENTAAIYFPGAGTLATEGALSGTHGIVARAGNVAVNGGSVTATGTAPAVIGDTAVEVPCAAVVYDTASDYYWYAAGDGVEINGGTISSEVEPCVLQIADEGDEAAVSIPAGSAALFSDAKAEGVPEGYALVESESEPGFYAIAKVWTVSFVNEKGEAPEAQTVVDGETATEPEAPEAEGFLFGGWFAEGATEAFDFDTAIEADLTLTAAWTEKLPEDYRIGDNLPEGIEWITVTEDTVTVRVVVPEGATASLLAASGLSDEDAFSPVESVATDVEEEGAYLYTKLVCTLQAGDTMKFFRVKLVR